MATTQLARVIHDLRTSALLRDDAGLSDEQLLNDYLVQREEVFLAALIRKHSRMVWGVCRRVLSNHHDAEDAFQATFLVLVRKAPCIASPHLLANWLYGVAHQTAIKARATAAKRRTREMQPVQMPERAIEPPVWNELQPLLDQELSRLPDKYRSAIVLCELEGKTRREAAGQLGVPEGTLAARLARGRLMLAKRLSRCGLAISGGALSLALSQGLACAAVPTSTVASTIKATSLFASGSVASKALIPLKVIALAEGVMKAMIVTKAKMIAATLLLVLVGLGGVVQLSQSSAIQPGVKENFAHQATALQEQPGSLPTWHVGPVLTGHGGQVRRVAF